MLDATVFASLLNPLPALVQSQLARLGCAAINHLLKLEPTVQAHLNAHVQRTVLLRWQAIGLAPAGEQALRINDDLTVSPIETNNPAQLDVTVTVQSGIAQAPAQERLRYVRLEGDLLLAQDLSKVLSELRWDAEHDLARVIGDAPAYMVVQNAKKIIPVVKQLLTQLKGQIDAWAGKQSSQP